MVTAVKERERVKPVTFRSKSERKRYRKGLVRNYMANKAADHAIRKESKREFYRRLRMMKLDRYAVAKKASLVVDALADLRRSARRADLLAMNVGVNSLVGEVAAQSVHGAKGSAEELRDMLWLVARQRIRQGDYRG